MDKKSKKSCLKLQIGQKVDKNGQNVDSCRHKNGKSGHKVEKCGQKGTKTSKFLKYIDKRRAKGGQYPQKKTKNINETSKSDLTKLELEKCG